jgi:mono/diheme cytochrome c family protein
MSRFALPLLASFTLATLAPAQEVKRSDLKPGLIFTSQDKSGFAVSRLESGVSLTLLAGDSAHPRSDGGESFTWTGYIQVMSAGKYTFAADLLGKLTVTIGDQKVFSETVKGGGNAPRVSGEEVELQPGIQKFTATLMRLDKTARVSLQWQGPRFRNEPVPYFFFGHTEKQRPAGFGDDVKREHGRLLFEELACAKCHTPTADDKMAKGLADRTGPNLTKLAERAYPGWVDAWLTDPKKLRPHTAMPAMFADDANGKIERHAVLSYLYSLGKPVQAYKPPLVYPNDLKESIARGGKLYLTGGCAACHGDQLTAPPTKKKNDDPDAPDEKPFDPLASLYGVGGSPQAFYTLNHVGSKFRPDTLAKFLKNPTETNPHGRMPAMALTDGEALDLANHLCTVTDEQIDPKMPEPPPTPDVKIDWVAKGREVFGAKGCANCHTLEEQGKAVAATATSPKLADVTKASDKGCLAEKPSAKAANYSLSAEQRSALQAFLKDGLSGAGSPSPVHAARISVKRFNCLNCHQRDGEGGIDAFLADKMKALENAENADDVQPPKLTGVGHKMRTSWMKDVLLNAGRARPWMSLRMPQYGTANVGSLHEHLPLLDGAVTDDAVAKPTYTKEKLETGRALAGKQGHGCISCHDISGQRGGGTRGPDLATTNQRVRYDWYTRWMHQPQRMVPGTKMPQAFIEGKSLLDQYFKGDGDQQIDALWAYFSMGPGLPLPAGMEPTQGLTVVVRDKPEILRTFMPDNAGTRCVAVGFPGGVSTVFDSHQCRLAYAWSGNFLDVKPVWDGRGGNPAKLLGTKFYTAPAGFPWAMTAGSDTPDFDKIAKDPAHGGPLKDAEAYTGPMAVRFKGYTTDDGGLPTFKYQLTPDDGKTVLSITEAPKPATASVVNGLTRKFTVAGPNGKAVWFHVAGVPKEPKLIDADGGEVKFAETVPAGTRLLVPTTGEAVNVFALTGPPSGAEWRFVKEPVGYRVLVKLPEGKSEFALTVWALPKPDPAFLKELK